MVKMLIFKNHNSQAVEICIVYRLIFSCYNKEIMQWPAHLKDNYMFIVAFYTKHIVSKQIQSV